MADNEILVFGEYTTGDVVVNDPGIKAYINLKPVIVPRSSGRGATQAFWKTKYYSIVERFINKIPVTGHKGDKHWRTSGRNLGKYNMLYNIAKETFKIIKEKTGKNPVQVLVSAIEKGSPFEEVMTIQYGGIRHPKSIDTSPQRRVDLALRWIAQAGFAGTVKSKTHISTHLAKEIMAAASGDPKSFTLNKKNEMERQAAASR